MAIGIQGIGFPGVPVEGSGAVSVNADGSAVLGLVAGLNQPAIWTAESGWTSLSGLQHEATASSLSADGSIVAGTYVLPGGGFEAFRWTAVGGPVTIGPGGATGMSGNGGVICGVNFATGYRWTEATGSVALAPFPGRTYARADAVSLDGTTIVGEADVGVATVAAHAVRWVGNGLLEDLGDIAGGGDGSRALAVNADGSVIVGQGTGPTGSEASLWTAQTGMVSLRTHLLSLGVPGLENWHLIQATAISADGMVIAGYGRRGPASAPTEGFVAVIPTPASVLVLVGVAWVARRKR